MKLLALVLAICVLPVLAFAQGEATGGAGDIQWVTLAVAAVAMLLTLLREIAPKTPNTYDDAALAFLSKLSTGQLVHLGYMLDPKSNVKTGPTPNKPTGV